MISTMNTPYYSDLLTPSNMATLVDTEIELFTPIGGDSYRIDFLWTISSLTGPGSSCTLTPKVFQDIPVGPMRPGGSESTSFGPITIPELPIADLPPAPALSGSQSLVGFLCAPGAGPLKFILQKSGTLDIADYMVYLQVNFFKLPME